jgi:hypothetical protein
LQRFLKDKPDSIKKVIFDNIFSSYIYNKTLSIRNFGDLVREIIWISYLSELKITSVTLDYSGVWTSMLQGITLIQNIELIEVDASAI